MTTPQPPKAPPPGRRGPTILGDRVESPNPKDTSRCRTDNGGKGAASEPATSTGPDPIAPPPSRATSAAQVEANRRNAQRSTGPRSADGKRRSSLNAMRHGAYG